MDSIQRKSEYWLEIKEADKNLEISNKVYSWNEAISLLETYQWTNYESEFVYPLYFDLILEAKGKRKNYNAQQRLLEILRRLEANETINVQNAVDEFNIGKHQIQRDIKALNEFFQYSNKQVDYKRDKKGYELDTMGDFFTIEDALLVLLLLYGTRSLNKDELKRFSEKLIRLFSKAEQVKLRNFFQSYLYYYKPVQEESLFELFDECFQAISQKHILKFTYTNNKGETSMRKVLPETITYHDRKFYLHARLVGREEENPRAWLVDRIRDCTITKQKFTAAADLKVGEFIQKAVNMYGGESQNIKLLVKESNIPYLKRNFPEVKIQPSSKISWVVAKLEVLGFMGIKLWILKQGPYVEVLEPMELREQVKELINEMYQMYFAGKSDENNNHC